MGLYLEPEMDKKDWLDKNGALIVQGVNDPKINYNSIEGLNKTKVLICNVDNGFFMASAVAFSESEYNAFAGIDGRFKWWYLVDKSLAKSVVNEDIWNGYMGVNK